MFKNFQANNYRVQNPNTPHARRVRAAHGGAAGHGGAGQKDGMPTVRSAQKTTVPVSPQSIVDNCPERLFGSTNKGILCKPVEEQNNRLTSGLLPVQQRDHERSSLLAVDQCTDGYLSL